jgi:hypothetical protein
MKESQPLKTKPIFLTMQQGWASDRLRLFVVFLKPVT